MRIAIFSDTFYPKIDGIVTFIQHAADYLNKHGHKVLIVCPQYSKADPDVPYAKLIRLFSVSLPTYKEVKIVLFRFSTLMKGLRAFKPDLIHINTPGSIGVAGIQAARKLGIPVLGTYHTLVSEQMIYVSPMNLLGINKLLGRQPNTSAFLKKEKSILKEFGWWSSLKVYNRCDMVAAPSKAIVKLLQERKVKPPAVFLSNGIDLKSFTPKKSYPKRKGLLLLHVGRISFEKNIDTIVKAVEICVKTEKNIHLHVVGGGPALDSLKKMTEERKLLQYITFHGRVDNKKLKHLYQESDAFVTASPMETQGIVILEAMASGLPVIGVRKYAIPDLVKDHFNGFLAEPYDEKSMTKAILKMVKNRSLLKTYGKNALKTVKEHELNRCMKIVEKTFKSAISR
ncbi:glycosyltransferase family 4 protein [Candidatus Woesearchaeota archaeon]|nr:glycosyltransferase family 4 protein [Candidatus Woesearchaeota archaeon]